MLWSVLLQVRQIQPVQFQHHPSRVIKLFADLMLHYETSVCAFENETASGGAYERIYKQYKKILDDSIGDSVPL